MPRTRNVTRAQWDAANATNSITAGDQNYNHVCESEKENEGRPVIPATRATRSHTRTGSNRVLGSTTTNNLRISTTSKGPQNTVPTKVKGKGKVKAPPPKRKKLPLQDITSQFLPAPEAANRGEENEGTEHGNFQQIVQRGNFGSPLPLAQILGSGDVFGPTSHPGTTYPDSPLPPSSPPSAITPSPQYPKILTNATPSWLHRLSPENNLGGGSASHGSVSMISSSSDPFGFVALERKLKVERRAAPPSPLKPHQQQDEPDEEVLVADTSSPRLVRRLKRPSFQDDPSAAVSERPNYVTPLTPHKDNRKRPRLSHKGDPFSPCSSSIPSTPSPSKRPVQKHPGREDGLKNKLKGDQEVEGVLKRTRNRTARGIVKGEPPSTLKVTKFSLESLDDDAENEEEQADPKRAKPAQAIKAAKKSRSAGTKKSKKEKVEEEEEYGEKWEQERQERAAYFKRLEGYQVEKEDVFVI